MWAAGAENVVVVAVRAERENSKEALAWALTHVVRPGDLVILLAVISDHDDARTKHGWRWRLWALSRFSGDCGNRRRGARCQISASCSQMALQIDGNNEINVKIKVVGSEAGGGGNRGVVAAESKTVGANWVVLDKQLRQEEKHCMEELQCNIVVMNGSRGRILRLNLGGGLHKPRTPFSSSCAPTPAEANDKFLDDRIKHSTAVSSLGEIKASFLQETRASASSGGASRANSLFVCERSPLFERITDGSLGSDAEISTSEAHTPGSDSSRGASPLFATNPWHEFRSAHRTLCKTQTKPGAHRASTSTSALAGNRAGYCVSQTQVSQVVQKRETNYSTRPPSTTGTLQERFCESDATSARLCPSPAEDHTHSSDVREAVSLFRSSPSVPPPLCSLCRHKAPAFGKPPRQFSYQELEEVTNGFSDDNFLAEGALGCVHRGVLEDGRMVAVKRLKTDFTACVVERDDKFLSEVEVLSRAQHRNVVMLVGYCVQGKSRVLVYEYVCNGSLDLHLYGLGKPPLELDARIKIAVGVARGLRYLHEDCRVGFVVHKDLRPSNILLTHDFEPLVGDLSLRTAQAGMSFSVESHVPRTFGYMAPEHIEHGVVTDKADVYAFGVVLLEILTGRKAIDFSQPKGQQFLAEWTRPLLSTASEDHGQQTMALDRFLDPRLDRYQSRSFSHQLCAMICAASMCLRRDPQARPTMSKVLRVLEGDTFIDPMFEMEAVGSRSGRMTNPISHQDIRKGGSLSLRFSDEAVSNALYY